jgi:hypothetical protein
MRLSIARSNASALRWAMLSSSQSRVNGRLGFSTNKRSRSNSLAVRVDSVPSARISTCRWSTSIWAKRWISGRSLIEGRLSDNGVWKILRRRAQAAELRVDQTERLPLLRAASSPKPICTAR